MNPISDQIKTGTLGELLVQLRLLQYGVQAAPPIKDSGNDLIAVKGEVFKALQVKTTTTQIYSKANLPDHYHILAVVQLVGEDDQIYLDNSRIFLIPAVKVEGLSTSVDNIEEYLLDAQLIEKHFTQ